MVIAAIHVTVMHLGNDFEHEILKESLCTNSGMKRTRKRAKTKPTKELNNNNKK